MSLSSIPLTRIAPVVAAVRAREVADPVALCTALAEGGIHWVEFNTAVPAPAARPVGAAGRPGTRVGVGPILTVNQAESAAARGAAFLVAPGCDPAIARAARRLGLPFVLGALTATDIADAAHLGASAVKVFPAGTVGPRYFQEMHDRYPHLPMIAAGGVGADDAADYLAAGAAAVCVGEDVVSPAAVASGDWAEITRRARDFTAGLPEWCAASRAPGRPGQLASVTARAMAVPW